MWLNTENRIDVQKIFIWFQIGGCSYLRTDLSDQFKRWILSTCAGPSLPWKQQSRSNRLFNLLGSSQCSGITFYRETWHFFIDMLIGGYKQALLVGRIRQDAHDGGPLAILETIWQIKKCSILCMTYALPELPTSQVGCIYLSLKQQLFIINSMYFNTA